MFCPSLIRVNDLLNETSAVCIVNDREVALISTRCKHPGQMGRSLFQSGIQMCI
jgi:hypothetical protein